MHVKAKKAAVLGLTLVISCTSSHTSFGTLLKESNCAYVSSTSLLDIANIINELGDYKVPIYVDTQIGINYESTFNAPYRLKYIGLEQGILETYNKLKNEY